MPGSHLIITTHTTRHLRRTLLGVSCLARMPARTVVACDNDREDVRALVRECSAEFGAGFPDGLWLVQRETSGVSASAQVRNNGVRTALAGGGDEPDTLLFLDGDCCPAFDWGARLEELGRCADLVIGHRVDLTPEQTEAFDEDRVRRHQPPADIAPTQHGALRSREGRYRRTLLVRSLGVPGLVKAHKPKVLSANFAVSLRAYRAINGFDEEYLGYGSEDDDLGRRLYSAGFRATLGITSATVYHQWHPTRAAADWRSSPGVARFNGPWTSRCEHGLENPAFQRPVRAEWFAGGALRERWGVA